MYKVGQKVLLKPEKQLLTMKGIQVHYNTTYKGSIEYTDSVVGNAIIEEMLPFLGTIVTIRSVDSDGKPCEHTRYYIEEDENGYTYYERWFIPLDKAGQVLFGEKNE